MTVAITVAYGDDTSPAQLEAALYVLREAGAQIKLETIEIGSRIYAMDYPKGILPSSFSSLDRTRILLIGHTNSPPEGEQRTVAMIVREHYMLDEPHKQTTSMAIPGTDISAHSYVNENFAVFEAQQPTPASMLLAAISMLSHIGQQKVADKITVAMQKTLTEGIPNPSLFKRLLGTAKPDTQLFAEAVSGALSKDYKQVTS